MICVECGFPIGDEVVFVARADDGVLHLEPVHPVHEPVVPHPLGEAA